MFASLILGLSTFTTGQIFNQPVQWNLPQRMNPKIAGVYLPFGFDDDDVAQVIVEFEMQNTCEELGNVTVIPHEEYPGVLQLYYEGYKREGNCKAATNNPIVAVDIGVLQQGIYEIRDFKNLEKIYGHLNVRKAMTAKIDNNNYAPVDSFIVHADEAGFRRLITLAGTFSNTCLHFVRDQVRIVKTGEKLIEILPVIDKAENENCKEQDVPFLETFKIPEREDALAIRTGRYIFHVRTMNIHSFNKADRVTTPN